jgi:hypothetical protein
VSRRIRGRTPIQVTFEPAECPSDPAAINSLCPLRRSNLAVPVENAVDKSWCREPVTPRGLKTCVPVLDTGRESAQNKFLEDAVRYVGAEVYGK